MNRNEMEVSEKKEAVLSGEPTKSMKHFVPAVDIYEDDNAVTVVAEMPGVGKEDVEIHLENGALTIAGGSRQNDRVKDRNMLLQEYESGIYTRKFSVADTIDQDKISATMKNGILTVTLPKAEPAKPRAIPVVTE